LKIYFAGNSGYWAIKDIIEKTYINNVLISYHYTLENPNHYMKKGIEYLRKNNKQTLKEYMESEETYCDLCDRKRKCEKSKDNLWVCIVCKRLYYLIK
tara:strand:- start:907 stop:1200 length:294 start_codon:yes stop_codon:yes gene_type:complete